MKTNLFRPKEYFRPGTVTEVLSILAEHGENAGVIAGGTDILVDRDPGMNYLVDISDLGLNYIKNDDRGIKIGAATTFAELESAAVLEKEPYHILTHAARSMGTPQIRNVATIGGNIASALPSADSAPPLLALDASVRIKGPSRERMIHISDFFLGPRENALKQGEILTEFCIPEFPSGTMAKFNKKGRVAVADLALVNLAARFTIGKSTVCKDVRIALGAVAPTPIRVKKAEAMLEGHKPEAGLLVDVAIQVSKEIRPISDLRSSADYRKTITRNLMEQVLKELANPDVL